MRLRDQRAARSVYGSLLPDNVGVPACMRLSMERRGRTVGVEIDSECGMDTLISTVDDVLRTCELSLASVRSAGDGDC